MAESPEFASGSPSTPEEAARPRLRMPPEWAPHELTLIAWPAREEAWRGVGIEDARECHARVVEAVAAFEPVLLVVDPAHETAARARVTAENVELLAVTIDDSWLRDSGPILVTDGAGGRAGVDFRFNAWGEAFHPYDRDAAVSERILSHLGIERIPSELVLEGGSIAVDGEGTVVTTEQCLLNPNRNPGLGRQEIEAEVLRRLGAERMVWLGRGLLEDADTDGHVDNVCAFLGPGRALIQTAPPEDPNHEPAAANVERLRRAGIEAVEWELLPRAERADGEPVVVPYTNFYVANGAVILPVAGIDMDMDAEAAIRIGALFPGRRVVPVNAKVLAMGGGGIHCITQQVPEA